MSAIPQKSRAYLYAQDIFFQQFNEVSFYVEDSGMENFYFVVLTKLFPKLKIDRVFPLGGKQPLIEHARSTVSTKRDVYITDKDYDDVLGNEVILENLFYLRKYSIENYLLEKNALVNFVLSERPRLRRTNVSREIKIKATLDDYYRTLYGLIMLHIIVQKFLGISTISNVSLGVERFCDNAKRILIDQAKVQSYEMQVEGEVHTRLPMVTVASLKNEIRNAIGDYRSETYKANVPGKYLLVLLRNRLREYFDITSRCDIDSFSYRLAKDCKFSELAYLRNQINSFIAE